MTTARRGLKVNVVGKLMRSVRPRSRAVFLVSYGAQFLWSTNATRLLVENAFSLMS